MQVGGVCLCCRQWQAFHLLTMEPTIGMNCFLWCDFHFFIAWNKQLSGNWTRLHYCKKFVSVNCNEVTLWSPHLETSDYEFPMFSMSQQWVTYCGRWQHRTCTKLKFSVFASYAWTCVIAPLTWVMSQTCDQQRFTISEVVAGWHEPMMPQRIMWPSIANG